MIGVAAWLSVIAEIKGQSVDRLMHHAGIETDMFHDVNFAPFWPLDFGISRQHSDRGPCDNTARKLGPDLKKTVSTAARIL